MSPQTRLIVVTVALVAVVSVLTVADQLRFFSTSTGTGSTSGALVSAPCPDLVATTTGQGYTLEVYLSNQTKVGNQVCVGLVVINDSGGTPNVQGIVGSYNITDSSGRTVDESSAGAVLGTGTLRPGQYISSVAYWNSSTPYDGLAPQAGTYHIACRVVVPQSGPHPEVDLAAEADLSLTG